MNAVLVLVALGIGLTIVYVKYRGVVRVRTNADPPLHRWVNQFASAAEHYRQDEGAYPGQEDADGRANQFPVLFNAIFGERRPMGSGGRNAPYMELRQDRVVVYDNERQDYRPARRADIYAPHVQKFVLDDWGHPLVYRVHGAGFQLYSVGPDGIDQTILGAGDSDDIGSR